MRVALKVKASMSDSDDSIDGATMCATEGLTHGLSQMVFTHGLGWTKSEIEVLSSDNSDNLVVRATLSATEGTMHGLPCDLKTRKKQGRGHMSTTKWPVDTKRMSGECAPGLRNGRYLRPHAHPLDTYKIGRLSAEHYGRWSHTWLVVLSKDRGIPRDGLRYSKRVSG